MKPHPVRTIGATKLLPLLAAVSLLLACGPPHEERAASDPALDFEQAVVDGEVLPPGWHAAPSSTVILVRDVVFRGANSMRLRRDEASANTFSMIARRLPALREGGWIELSGMLRTAGVDGHAGLWFRQDREGETLQFDNMAERGLRGDAEWKHLSLRQPIDPLATHWVFGALLSGTGELWVDALELRVDGRPMSLEALKAAASTQRDSASVKAPRPGPTSGVALASITPEQADGLVLLGRVWGFLKYHHPAVRSGTFDWDSELFRMIPALLDAPEAVAQQALLRDWVMALGDVPPCEPCAELPPDRHLEAPVNWLDEHALLGEPLAKALGAIYARRPADVGQHYVDTAKGVGNPLFDSESTHASASLDDSGHRLLAVFRLWAIVQYWFPYRDLMPADWEAGLADVIQRVVAAPDAAAYQREMAKLVASIGDGHAALWSAASVLPPSGDCRLPVALRFVEGRPTVVRVAEDDGDLAVGDVIKAIDDTAIDQLVADWLPHYAGSNVSARYHSLAQAMPRGACGQVSVTVSRADGEHVLRLARSAGKAIRPRHDRNGDTVQMLDGNIGYLTLSSVKADEVPGYLEALKDSAALVIDIRTYPSDFVVFALGRHLVERETAFARFSVPDLANPGVFSFTPPISLSPQAPHYGRPLAILVDEQSMSQSEYTAMAFRSAPDAVVVGSTTAGADGNLSPLTLPAGMRTSVSGIGVFYPNKRPTQRIGIVPDIVVVPTLDGIRAGRDEVLEAASAHLRSTQSRRP